MNAPAPLTTPLWDWSLATYARPGVKDALLALQLDHDIDVCLLLWRTWLADAAHAPLPALEAEAVALSDIWRASVVGPLRAARNALNPAPDNVDHDNAAALRKRVLDVELDAERLQLEALEALARAPSMLASCGADLGDALAEFGPLAHVPEADISTLIRALTHR